MNRRTVLLLGAGALAACATPRSRDFALARDLDARIDVAMARLAVVPGLAVAVYSREGAYARGFGLTDVVTGERADADTAFYIASSTKPLTALALAALHHRGELDMDATLARYAPEAVFADSVRAGEVALRHLLTHTHGIHNDAIVHRTAFSGEHDPAILWRLLAHSSLNAGAPLGQFEYTNVGYNIATILTDRRLGVRWQDLLAREVFSPAGMTRTSARMSITAGWRVAKPHLGAAPGGVQRLYLEKTDQTMQSAGGVIMSANDAARWLELMLEGGRIGARQVIPEAVVALTQAPVATLQHAFEGYQRERYALGWYHGPYRDELLLHHFGGFAGFRAHVSYMPARHIGVAAFTNDASVGPGLANAIANYVYDITAGRADAEATFEAAIAAAEQARTQISQRLSAGAASRASRAWTLTRPREAYEGAYANEAWGRFEIALEAGTMMVRNGVLQAQAEPFTQPDTIRVELTPTQGAVIGFEGAGARPEALVFQGQRFGRA